MNSLRKWLYRPKKDDTSLMAQFYYADEELNMVAGELDSFDGRKDPERCTALVNQLRQAQDKVLNICIEMMDELLPDERAHRDFRVKFPDDIMQETLSGQLWFGAECLAAGSSILNRESESIRMRPLARAVTKTVENVRNLLREQCLKPIPEYTEKIRESLKIFDRLFSEFEFCYVSAMVPVKTVDEYEMQQNVVVLFSETLQRAVKLQLISQDQIDYSDPALMFTVPRLAIVAGLVIFPDSPLKLEKDPKALSELFRPFKNLLQKIRELLWTMSPQELATLEKCLCSMEEPDISIQSIEKEPVLSNSPYHGPVAYTSDFVHRFCSSFPSCRQLTPDFICLYSSGKKSDRSERKRDRPSSKSSRTRARQERQSERFLSRLTGLEERPKSKRSKRPTNSHSQRSYTGHSHSRDYSPSSHYYPPRSVESTHQSSRHSSTRRPSRMKHGSSSDRGDARSRSSARPRRSRVSRQHSDRINTIICVCGSSRGQTDQSGERVGSQSGVEHHCPCTNRRIRREQVDHNVDSHPYSSLYFSQYNAQSCQHSEGLGSNVESEQLNREATIRPNIQSCVTNAVSDPEVLSSISMFNNQAIPMIGPGSDVPYPDPVDVNLSDDFQNIVYLSGNEHTSSKKYSCDNQRNVNSSYLQEPITHSELPSPTSMSSATKESQSESQGSSTQNSTQAFADTRLNQTTPEPYCSAMSSPVHQRDVPKVQETLEVPSRNVHSPDGYEDVSSGSTSPHQSGPEDDEEIALAMQAAEVAVSWKARERFTDSTDLIQRLFVCISGVADQLQTNCASDMRRILRSVFVMNQTPDEDPEETKDDKLKFTDDKESSSEDARSSNGSEELSVESAEDAMAVIGTPEVSGSFHSPPHELASDSEEEEPTSTSFDAIPGTSESRMLHRGSIVVPASVFNDHSLMQYSALSPPPITMGPHSQELLIDGEMDIGGASAYPGTIYMPESSEVYSSPRNEQNILFKFDSQQEIGGSCLLDSNIDGQQDLPIISAVPAAASPHPTDSPVSNVHSSSNMGSPDLSEGRQRRYSIVQEPPPWLPDESAPRCMACGALFTMVRRRHHCRNCGKVFCGHCSRHSVPLPHFGIWKSVRVCNACFLYYVTSTADGSAALS